MASHRTLPFGNQESRAKAMIFIKRVAGQSASARKRRR
jgi:hypothetical protein